ncbi:DUF1002 domain-containing protein [Caldalkalibacillus salinus]|uniref:DUF1002 domain-containing protein n=1 Tax=Caldalkalibacillus salinus TaxID=2803787 RepID=UPI001924E015|nr:DUF1002 domain-containing protein [Caldalkalibacillus salinus]
MSPFHRRSKVWLILSIAAMVCLIFPFQVLADEAQGEVGKTVVSLGNDLSDDQQQQLLEEMDVVEEDVDILYVTNEEEYHYLGDYYSASEIGSNAISSVRITLTEEGSGIEVKTNNITSITPEMYTNALVTAGIQDAEVYVTAPTGVSGTAALTGVLKAFEVAADTDISEEQKEVANEEMVRTRELAERIGAEEAAELVMRLKEALGEQELNTDEDYRELINRVAAELNIELTEKDVESLVHLLKRIKDLNINWDQVGQQLRHIRDNLGDILQREETENLIQSILNFLIELVEQIKDMFGQGQSNEEG